MNTTGQEIAVADENQKWLSSKLEASLMEALDKKAKSIGLSRSEAVRKAIEQWVDGSSKEPADEASSGAEIIERLERIESKLGSASENDVVEEREGEEDTGSSEEAQDGEGLGQMQMYEGEDLLNWIDSESEKPTGSQE